MKQPRNPTKKGASSRAKPSHAQIPGGTPSREQLREATAPQVNVPRQSKRPAERGNQSRSRGRRS